MSERAIHSNRFVVLRLLFAVSVWPMAGAADESTPYPVRFENSCSPAVQATFSRAITLLHSFEYPETSRLFGQIIDRDPDCAMAYWGAAMSIWHPLWAPPGGEELEAGARILDTAKEHAATPRETAYIDALRAFFSGNDTSTHIGRARDYEERMSRVYSENLDDPEAAIFYALALLATNDPHDKTYAHQFKAAGLLNWVRESQPGHPGVMHYLIHSYDYPGLAHLALGVAKAYAKAAPDSAHAQHMPSHIFMRLGLWDLAISSNEDSAKSAADFTLRAHLPGHYDEGLHSMDYLMYALLQVARDEEARKLLVKLAQIRKTDTENFKVAYAYAASPARYALERREWIEASKLTLIRKDFPWDEFGWAESIHYFARGIGAARSGQPEKAREQLQTIKALQKALPAATLPYWKEEVQVHIDAVTSWILLAEGQASEALRSAALSADREDTVDKHPVTPGEVLPARELYADMLLETGHDADALQQYRAVLRGSPNRLNSLIGAAAAASGMGDSTLAGQYDAVIRRQTSSGTRRRAGLRTTE